MRWFVISLAALTFSSTAAEVEIVNNLPFPINQPVDVQTPDGRTVSVVASAMRGQTVRVPMETPPKSGVDADLSASGNSIEMWQYGRLSWSVLVEPKNPSIQDPPPSTKHDFAKLFKPLPLKFTAEKPHVWRAEATDQGLKVSVEVRNIVPQKFIDVHTTVENVSAPTKDVYAALICRWDQDWYTQAPDENDPKTFHDKRQLNVIHSRTLDYDNHRMPFENAYSPFRGGADRSQYVQRGVDWLNTHFSNATVLWMNDFTPSFTYHRKATAKTPAHWVGANTAQLAQEMQADQHVIYSITELARPQVKNYRSRVQDNVLPPPGEPETISNRIIIRDHSFDDDDWADNQFVAYTTYRTHEKLPNGDVRVTFGVPFTTFGTSYLPYSTLGENFITYRQPGMSTEGYWPLAPETVKHFDKFRDEIRCDLRSLKSLGFDLVRLHHLELIYNKDKDGKHVIDAATRKAYLDFLFGEFKSLRLKALLDVKLPPQEVADLVKRYREQVAGVEIDNEVLLMQGVVDEDVPTWKKIYAAVKQVAPEIPVHLTAHTNSGAFNRLIKEGVPFDKLGEHAYLDSLEAIPSARDYGLAMADFGSKIGKPPCITEWNWRFLTHMTFEDRARIYPPIFENVLATRCMPEMYQFQYQDSLAINPATLRGMRRYELLLLSRRPKPEAFEFEKLIDKYGKKDAPHQVLGINHAAAEFNDGIATANITLVNHGDKPLALTATAEGPAGVKMEVAKKITVAPSASVAVPMKLELPADAQPGFYHAFVRLEGPNGFLRYGWAEARLAGALKIDKTPAAGVTYGDGALDFNFNRPLTVVYADDANPTDVEAAWTLFITLESATGRPVRIYQQKDFKQDKPANVILVEVTKTDSPTVRLEDGKLLVTGNSAKQVLAASMDLTLRYWKYAKDSGIPRVGLTTDRVEGKGSKTDLE